MLARAGASVLSKVNRRGLHVRKAARSQSTRWAMCEPELVVDEAMLDGSFGLSPAALSWLDASPLGHGVAWKENDTVTCAQS